MTSDEIIAQFPKLTRTQHLARIREDQAMFDPYPGRYVAYIDNWEGETLKRSIIIVEADASEFHNRIANLTPEIRQQIDLTFTPEADVISVPFMSLS
jgi:hypothetical protein